MVILGLGSNLGDRARYLDEALARLGNIMDDMRVSRIYETRALLPAGAPPGWDINYLNLAVRGETALAVTHLLAAVKNIERDMGRVATGHWSPRIIDIDVLAVNEEITDLPDIKIPHRELLNRDFALLPFAELAPDWRWPLAGEYQHKTSAEIAAARGYRCGATLTETGIAFYEAA